MYVHRYERDGKEWIVGYYISDADGTEWTPLRAFKKAYQAAMFIHFLNGGQFGVTEIMEDYDE